MNEITPLHRDIFTGAADIATPRRFIRHPAPAKLWRWTLSLHEAGHAAAYVHLCGSWAAAFVWDDQGICCHSFGNRDLFAHAAATAAGAAAEHLRWFAPVPKGRPRRRRGPRTRPFGPDHEAVARLLGFMNADSIAAETTSPSTADVEDAALQFAREYASEIIRIAQKLYLSGRVYVPAPPKCTPANVSLAEKSHVAAVAAEG